MSKALKPAVSLRQSLQTRVGLLVCSAVLLMGFGVFLFGLKPIVERIAADQFTVASAQVEANLNSVFQPAEQILRMSPGWIGNEPPDLNNPAVFNQLFRPVLEHYRKPLPSLPARLPAKAGFSFNSPTENGAIG